MMYLDSRCVWGRLATAHSVVNSQIMNSMHPKLKMLVFTDLDGCLLDHHDYSYQPAIELLQKLQFENIPVIPTTSKTESEVRHLRKSLANEHPFIIENGAAVFIPKGYFPEAPKDCIETDGFWIKEFTKSRQHWLSMISQTNLSTDKFQTFSESTISDIVKLTGLDHDAAVRASNRRYGEPIAWYGTEAEKQQFIAELKRSGANVMQGGRFLHVSGNCNKGKALNWLTDQYKGILRELVLTVAIGDSQNDITMLEMANIAVLIPSPSHPLPQIVKPQYVYTASQQGPSGWVESVSMILNTLYIQ